VRWQVSNNSCPRVRVRRLHRVRVLRLHRVRVRRLHRKLNAFTNTFVCRCVRNVLRARSERHDGRFAQSQNASKHDRCSCIPYHNALFLLDSVGPDQMAWMMSGGKFTSRSRRRQDGFSRRVPVQTSSGGSGRRCTLVLMSMAGWYHACLGQSGIRSRAGALDIRSFLTTAAISSTGGQSSRVSSRDQCDANSWWHWRRRKTGYSPSGRRGN
jgi:hypothetical protein